MAEKNDWYLPPVVSQKKVVMPDEIKHCSYNHFFDGTGMGLDINTKTVILMQQKLVKSYSFHDIREWKWEVPGYNEITPFGNVGLGPALQMWKQNSSAKKEAANNTGFTVRVKDIEYPSWFIRFPRNDTVVTELARWLEIFNQYVNNDKPIGNQIPSCPEISAPVQLKKFCTNCGIKCEPSTKFCSQCGTPVNR